MYRYSFNEGNEQKEISVVLTLTNPSSTDIIIHVQSRDVNATGTYVHYAYIFTSLVNLLHNVCIESDDYTAEPYTVTFPAGITMTSFKITLLGDDILESNEQFQLGINSLPDRVTISDPNQTTVTIIDDDRKPYHCVIYAL